MPVPTPPRSRPRLRRLARHPWTPQARRSRALRLWCARHGYLTPNFKISEMADTITRKLPLSKRRAARRHCFNLERLRHALGGVSIPIDGPYRTRTHNTAVGGARASRHMSGDATDHFTATCDAIVARSPEINTKADLVTVAERIFPGVGNETSGTLHLDSRPGRWARFVTWVRS